MYAVAKLLVGKFFTKILVKQYIAVQSDQGLHCLPYSLTRFFKFFSNYSNNYRYPNF